MKSSNRLSSWLIVLGLLTGCGLLLAGMWVIVAIRDGETIHSLGEKDYVFDPQTIFEHDNLIEGFEVAAEGPSKTPLIEPAALKQGEFLQLAESLVQADLGEGWYPVGMWFSVSCDEIVSGSQEMLFEFQKSPVHISEGKGLGVAAVTINSRQKTARWVASAYVPSFGTSRRSGAEVNLQILIDGQEALQIAKGEIENIYSDDQVAQCLIDVSLFGSNPVWIFTFWEVGDTETYSNQLGEVCINAKSGAVIICK